MFDLNKLVKVGLGVGPVQSYLSLGIEMAEQLNGQVGLPFQRYSILCGTFRFWYQFDKHRLLGRGCDRLRHWV